MSKQLVDYEKALSNQKAVTKIIKCFSKEKQHPKNTSSMTKVVICFSKD